MENTGFWIWLALVFGFGVLRYPAMRRARKTRTKRDERSATDMTLLGLAFLGLAAMPVTWRLTGWPAFADRPANGLVLAAGVIAGAGFLWLFRRSHHDLGRNWSVSLEVREDHQLVTKGVYAHVRHPMYTSFLLWGVMQALLISNWIAGLAGLLSVIVLVFGRYPREEAMMRETFGADYDAYCAKTARLVPGVF